MNMNKVKHIEFEGGPPECAGCSDGGNPPQCKPVGTKVCLGGWIFECRADGRWWNTHDDCPDP